MNLNEITQKYVGCPYKLGGKNTTEGFDCISLIFALANDLGITLSESYGGVTLSSYPELWQSHPEKAKRLLLRFISSLGEAIPVGKAFVGDLLILETENGELFVGMHAGHDLILSAFTDIGIALMTTRACTIRSAYRWV